MFSKKITESDAFLDMPLSTQALYLHLGMGADDDGFVNNPKKVQRAIGASEDDLKLLLAKNFIMAFETGIVVIKHWKINNYIAKDRYHPTVYTEEKALLSLKDNGAYSLGLTPFVPIVDKTEDKKAKKPKEEVVEPSVITLTLNDKSEYGVTQKQIDEYSELYPAVDVMQELRSMKGWCDANPTKRKTRGGINRFINTWLAKRQDRGGYGYDKKSQIDSWSRA